MATCCRCESQDGSSLNVPFSAHVVATMPIDMVQSKEHFVVTQDNHVQERDLSTKNHHIDRDIS